MRSTVIRMHVGGFLAPESYGPNERLVVNARIGAIVAPAMAVGSVGD
jgi:hypothetical protein